MNETEEVRILAPAVVRADGGEARWWMGSLAVIKATAADTGGQMAILEVTEPPGAEAPLHTHTREDEAFWVLDGNVEFEVGGESIPASPGDYVFGPRGIPHRYTVGKAGCRMLFICTPAGFEDLVRSLSEPAASRTLPPTLDPDGVDLERVEKAAGVCGIEVLG